MSRSLFEGYAPCLLIALIGYNAVGGSALAWAAFVWVFGAVLTVTMAYMRERMSEASMSPRNIQRAAENF